MLTNSNCNIHVTPCEAVASVIVELHNAVKIRVLTNECRQLNTIECSPINEQVITKEKPFTYNCQINYRSHKRKFWILK